MRFSKPQLAWAVVAGTVAALAVTLFVRRGVIDVLLLILVVAASVSTYLLRRYARAELLYRRQVFQHPQPESLLTADPTPSAGRKTPTEGRIPAPRNQSSPNDRRGAPCCSGGYAM